MFKSMLVSAEAEKGVGDSTCECTRDSPGLSDMARGRESTASAATRARRRARPPPSSSPASGWASPRAAAPAPCPPSTWGRFLPPNRGELSRPSPSHVGDSGCICRVGLHTSGGGKPHARGGEWLVHPFFSLSMASSGRALSVDRGLCQATRESDSRSIAGSGQSAFQGKRGQPRDSRAALLSAPRPSVDREVETPTLCSPACVCIFPLAPLAKVTLSTQFTPLLLSCPVQRGDAATGRCRRAHTQSSWSIKGARCP